MKITTHHNLSTNTLILHFDTKAKEMLMKSSEPLKAFCENREFDALPADHLFDLLASFTKANETLHQFIGKSRGLTQSDRKDLLQVLGFLAAILPVWVVAENLPPWEKIPKAGPHLKRVPNIYEKLRTQRVSDTGFRPIRMGDALILRESLMLKAHGSLQVLRGDLDHVTLTHRNALADLMRSVE